MEKGLDVEIFSYEKSSRIQHAQADLKPGKRTRRREKGDGKVCCREASMSKGEREALITTRSLASDGHESPGGSRQVDINEGQR